VERESAAEGEPDTTALSDGDLFGLRLAGQVLAHKAALAGRPRVARWFADLESVVSSELSRRGVGLVLVAEPELALAAGADAADIALLRDYLALLAGNASLSDAQRAYCQRLLEGVVS
jgi:hypothetical protein